VTCTSISEELSAYLDGELSPDVAAKVAEHLRYCPTCAAEAAELANIRGMVRALPPAPPRPHLAERTLRAVLRIHVRHAREHAAPRWWQRLFPAAAAFRRPGVVAVAVAVALALIIAPLSLGRALGHPNAARPETDWHAMSINLRQAPRTFLETAADAGKGIEGVFRGIRPRDRDQAPQAEPQRDGALPTGAPLCVFRAVPLGSLQARSVSGRSGA
jgi:hypothetical protein